MTNATVMTSGPMQRRTRITLEALADVAGASDYRVKRNGIVVEFAQEAQAATFRDSVLACEGVKNKLSNLSIAFPLCEHSIEVKRPTWPAPGRHSTSNFKRLRNFYGSNAEAARGYGDPPFE